MWDKHSERIVSITDTQKYLCMFIIDSMGDDADMKWMITGIYTISNILVKRLRQCND